MFARSFHLLVAYLEHSCVRFLRSRDFSLTLYVLWTYGSSRTRIHSNWCLIESLGSSSLPLFSEGVEQHDLTIVKADERGLTLRSTKRIERTRDCVFLAIHSMGTSFRSVYAVTDSV